MFSLRKFLNKKNSLNSATLTVMKLISGSDVYLEVKDFKEECDATVAKIEAVLRSKREPDLLFDREEVRDYVIRDFAGMKARIHTPRIRINEVLLSGRLSLDNDGYLGYQGNLLPSDTYGRPSDAEEGYCVWGMRNKRDQMRGVLKIEKAFFKLSADAPEKSYRRIELQIQNQVEVVLQEGSWFISR